MDGLDCYGSSDDEKIEAKTVGKTAVQLEIGMVEMASLPAAGSRTVDREL